LHPGDSEQSKALAVAVEFVRQDLADGQLNQANDWPHWRDTLIFREESRAIGESMIEARGSVRTVIGYCRFMEFLDSETPSATKRWSNVLLNFLLDLEDNGKDFRQTRLKRLVVHLVSLMELLNAEPIARYLLDKRDQLAADMR
jgi:hypothetical protein